MTAVPGRRPRPVLLPVREVAWRVGGVSCPEQLVCQSPGNTVHRVAGQVVADLSAFAGGPAVVDLPRVLVVETGVL